MNKFKHLFVWSIIFFTSCDVVPNVSPNQKVAQKANVAPQVAPMPPRQCIHLRSDLPQEELDWLILHSIWDAQKTSRLNSDNDYFYKIQCCEDCYLRLRHLAPEVSLLDEFHPFFHIDTPDENLPSGVIERNCTPVKISFIECEINKEEESPRITLLVQDFHIQKGKKTHLWDLFTFEKNPRSELSPIKYMGKATWKYNRFPPLH